MSIVTLLEDEVKGAHEAYLKELDRLKTLEAEAKKKFAEPGCMKKVDFVCFPLEIRKFFF